MIFPYQTIQENPSELTFFGSSIDELISRISRVMKLQSGDLILTGTPAGVGPIHVGDTIEGGLGHDFLQMHFKVVPKPQVLLK